MKVIVPFTSVREKFTVQKISIAENPAEVCKYNQTGFCKFREQCKKPHVNQVCENADCRKENCTRRHPKVCKHFNTKGKCRYKEECAYQHVEQVNIEKLFEIVSQVTITNHKEIGDLKEEVQELKTKIKAMEKHIEKCTTKLKAQSKMLSWN